MLRALICTAALFAFCSVSTAGELDKEAIAKTIASMPAPKAAASGSELDRESPTPAYHWHGGWGGYHSYGWGYRPFGFGGFYSPYRFGGFRTFGGWGYRPFYTGFYRPYFGGYLGFAPYGFYGYPWYW